MKIIFNADDFGLTKGVNLGVIECFFNGVVHSTTLMTNQFAFDDAIKQAKDNSGLGVGVHLVLTAGRPLVSGLKTLVDENGNFYKNAAVYEKAKIGHFDLDEVEKEYTAQIEKMIYAGVYPTHIDGHHHTHTIPQIFEVTAQLAKKYDLPVRVAKKSELNIDVKAVDEFKTDFYDKNINLDFLISNIKECIESGIDTVEYMTHVAYVDQALLNCSSYSYPRLKEMEIMTDPKLKQFLNDNNVEVINYTQIL